MDVRVGLQGNLSAEELTLLNCNDGEDAWESCTARRSNQSILKEIGPEYSLEGLMLKLKVQYFATWCNGLTYWKRPWCWERLKAGGEGDDRGWGGWMAPPTRWTWVWVNSRSWWWTGRPGVLWFMGLQRVAHDWGMNWTELINITVTSVGSRHPSPTIRTQEETLLRLFDLISKCVELLLNEEVINPVWLILK